ncbi:MAG: 3-phosphoshikimate 1-carboxyvinyltransferase, partial [Elusimicrobia bacterium]|nr:3-phosphoshikimate 1-carboxyvinyltransferase [Elusimicrobiota bacterium]
MRVRPGGPLRGQIRVPGDKSSAHRCLMLAALAEGVSELRGLPDCDDIAATRRCLEALGAIFEERPGRLLVYGRGPGGLLRPAGPLDAGESGTTARLLLGVLAGQPFAARLTGGPSLRRRPMARAAAPLRRMGARIRLSAGGRLPLRVSGGDLRGIRCRPPQASAQVKSAILLAGLFARGETVVVEPRPTRDHTERLLPLFGARLRKRGRAVRLRGGAPLRAARVDLPADPSAAAFWIAAAALVPGSRLRLRGVCATPRRLGFLRVLRRM